MYYNINKPDTGIQVDIIVPFWENDKHYLQQTIPAILNQNHANVTLHLIADGCDFPSLPDGNIVKYETSGGWGPYRITNAVYWNLKNPFMALNDADDISCPDRLWKQVMKLRKFNAEMISSSMVNVADETIKYNKRVKRLIGRTLPVKTVSKISPFGRCINGTRLMYNDLFGRVNGFVSGRCGMDTEFDNRVMHIGTFVYFDNEILANRTLHMQSLSNGAEFGIESPIRVRARKTILRNLRLMQKSPTIETARQLGDLDKTEILSPIN